jgi:hypothetical protein
MELMSRSRPTRSRLLPDTHSQCPSTKISEGVAGMPTLLIATRSMLESRKPVIFGIEKFAALSSHFFHHFDPDRPF